MSYATIDELRSQLGGPIAPKEPTPEYAAKMLHPFPATATTVKREPFVLMHCKGKRVLEFGASGLLTAALLEVSLSYQGYDRTPARSVDVFDLDDVGEVALPIVTNVEIIVCGEVLEHLGNPLHFLARLRKQYAGIPVIITVPSAFCAAQQRWTAKGLENVNADHVAWYSPKTLSVLLERAGYKTGGLFYYNGDGPTAEGLIVVTE